MGRVTSQPWPLSCVDRAPTPWKLCCVGSRDMHVFSQAVGKLFFIRGSRRCSRINWGSSSPFPWSVGKKRPSTSVAWRPVVWAALSWPLGHLPCRLSCCQQWLLGAWLGEGLLQGWGVWQLTWGAGHGAGLFKDPLDVQSLTWPLLGTLEFQSEPWSSDLSLLFCVRYYNWTTAAPLLLAMQAFQKPLPKVSFTMRKKRNMIMMAHCIWGIGI